jgi:hypothetical protein
MGLQPGLVPGFQFAVPSGLYLSLALDIGEKVGPAVGSVSKFGRWRIHRIFKKSVKTGKIRPK